MTRKGLGQQWDLSPDPSGTVLGKHMQKLKASRHCAGRRRREILDFMYSLMRPFT